jgi:hypothetical protein
MIDREIGVLDVTGIWVTGIELPRGAVKILDCGRLGLRIIVTGLVVECDIGNAIVDHAGHILDIVAIADAA